MGKNPRHLRYITLPFVAGILALVGIIGGPWKSVGTILLGMELWDLGWHSSVHHPDLFLARPIVRAGGIALAILGTVFLK